jgi:Zn finger protein HypA/HybF involved in hydrogenase expression
VPSGLIAIAGSPAESTCEGGDELEEPAELAFYCPECAEREFMN